MTELYKKYLDSCNIVSEKEFNYIMECFPNVTFDCDIDFDYATEGETGLYTDFLNNIVNKYSICAFIEDFNFVEREISLWDIASFEELNNIKNAIMPSWSVSNENQLIENLKNIKANQIREEIMSKIASLEINKLKEIYEIFNKG